MNASVENMLRSIGGTLGVGVLVLRVTGVTAIWLCSLLAVLRSVPLFLSSILTRHRPYGVGELMYPRYGAYTSSVWRPKLEDVYLRRYFPGLWPRTLPTFA